MSSIAGGVKDFVGGAIGATGPSLHDLAVGVEAGGLRSGVSGDRITVKSSRQRRRLVRRQARGFRGLRRELSGIRDLVRPGFSEFRKAGLERLGFQREATVGTLRENLARRRVQGSSFAQDAVSRTEAEFAQQEADFAAATTLKELEVFTQYTERISQAQQASIGARLSELNLQTQVALQLQTGAQQAITASSQMQQQLAGNFFSDLLGAGAFLGAASIMGPATPAATTPVNPTATQIA